MIRIQLSLIMSWHYHYWTTLVFTPVALIGNYVTENRLSQFCCFYFGLFQVTRFSTENLKAEILHGEIGCLGIGFQIDLASHYDDREFDLYLCPSLRLR